MKPITKLVQTPEGYAVQFWIGGQGFNLTPTVGHTQGDKDYTLQMKGMLDKAFEKLEEETRGELSRTISEMQRAGMESKRSKRHY